MYLNVNYIEYKRFLKENSNSDRISKGLKLHPVFEIFDREVKTEYSVSDRDYFIPESELFYKLKVKFYSKSNTKYRIDIWSMVDIVEEREERYNHLAFSLYDKKTDNPDYNEPTNKDELYDVMNRLTYIIKDMISKNIITNQFCVGGTSDLRKNKMYKSLLSSMGAKDIEKRAEDLYDEGWGLYFTLDDGKYIKEYIQYIESSKNKFKYLGVDNIEQLTEQSINNLKSKLRDNQINNLLK